MDVHHRYAGPEVCDEAGFQVIAVEEVTGVLGYEVASLAPLAVVTDDRPARWPRRGRPSPSSWRSVRGRGVHGPRV